MEPILVQTGYEMKQRELDAAVSRALSEAGIPRLDEAHSRFFLFDLSGSYWHDLGAVLWLVALLHRLKVQRNDVQLVLPDLVDEKSERVWDFLIRWEFFRALAVCVDEPSNILRPEQLPLLERTPRYSIGAKGQDESGQETVLHTLQLLEMKTILVRDGDQEQERADELEGKIIISALSSLCGWEPDMTKAFVQRVLREGVRNSLLHARGTFVNRCFMLDPRNLTLAMADNGLGIPGILRTALRGTRIGKDLLGGSDVDLIRYFTEPEMVLDSKLIKFSTEAGVSTRPGHAGVGLYYLKSLVLKQGGELRIRSGTACVDFSGKGEEAHDDLLDSPGTLLRIRTPLRRARHA